MYLKKSGVMQSVNSFFTHFKTELIKFIGSSFVLLVLNNYYFYKKLYIIANQCSQLIYFSSIKVNLKAAIKIL